VAAYQFQLKARIQLSGESLQEFVAAVKQLVHWALVRLPVDFIQREATHAFVDGVRDRKVKQHLLIFLWVATGCSTRASTSPLR
jgi:hypothetical protein